MKWIKEDIDGFVTLVLLPIPPPVPIPSFQAQSPHPNRGCHWNVDPDVDPVSAALPLEHRFPLGRIGGVQMGAAVAVVGCPRFLELGYSLRALGNTWVVT